MRAFTYTRTFGGQTIDCFESALGAPNEPRAEFNTPEELCAHWTKQSKGSTVYTVTHVLTDPKYFKAKETKVKLNPAKEKINSIKAIRQFCEDTFTCGAGLKISKDFVDAMITEDAAKDAQRQMDSHVAAILLKVPTGAFMDTLGKRLELLKALKLAGLTTSISAAAPLWDDILEDYIKKAA